MHENGGMAGFDTNKKGKREANGADIYKPDKAGQGIGIGIENGHE
jgi:hypothetical protein